MEIDKRGMFGYTAKNVAANEIVEEQGTPDQCFISIFPSKYIEIAKFGCSPFYFIFGQTHGYWHIMVVDMVNTLW